MNGRDLQLLISLLEKEYETNNHTSLSMTIYRVTEKYPVQDQELIYSLKRDLGLPTGSISRVVSKQLYNHLVHNNETLREVILGASELFNCKPYEVSDDQLCRYINQQH